MYRTVGTHPVAYSNRPTDMFKQLQTQPCLLKCIDSQKRTCVHRHFEWTPTKNQTHYATPLTEGPGFPHTGDSSVCANSLTTQLAMKHGEG